ncbi:MAG: c-type cytochrome [Nitrospinae bacterium]|nr:c-type cytochrome [Nitrospinota bacterium]
MFTQKPKRIGGRDSFCLKLMGLPVVLILLTGGAGFAEESDPMVPRVPASKMEEAKKLTAPFGDLWKAPPDIIAEGKKLFEGKGTCHNCHGKSGQGDGPVGQMLDPSPRSFTNCKFHHNRVDGELFWVVKFGSPGTGMVSLVPAVIGEEEAWKILAYERSFCKE